MRLANVRVGLRVALLVALTMLALPLLLAACGSDSLEGAWTPEKGAFSFEAGADGGGYWWDPDAPKPAGGVVVTVSDGVYHVTLVSADGERYQAASAELQDELLRVRISSSEQSPEFYLSRSDAGTVKMLAEAGGEPAPQAWSITCVAGSLAEGMEADGGQ